MELKHYVSVVWKWMWLIVLATGIAGASSYLATRDLPSTYQASTTLMVGQSIQSLNPNSSDLYTSQQLAATYIQIARTDPILRGVVDALAITIPPDQLRGMVSAWIIQGTQLIQIQVVDTNPRRAQAIANELARQLILQTPSSKEDDLATRRDFIQKQVIDLQARMEATQDKINELQESLKVTASAREIADKQQQITTLQGQMNQWQTTYVSLVNILSPRSPNQLSVVDPAQLPTTPIGPNTPLSILVAAAIGGLLALLSALLIEYIDETLKTPDDVARILKLPVVGTVPRIGGSDPARLVAARHPRSLHSEAYRVLRTNVQVADVDSPIKTLLVTSSKPFEGKSVTAANLAVVMAQAGMRVVLIDADMRRPVQAEIFGVPNDTGLTNLLLQADPCLDGYARSVDVENLQVLTTGHLPPNPSELLASKRMERLLERLKDQVDIILLDLPPCLPVADPAILVRKVDGVLLVVEAGKTRRDAAMKAKERLERAGGRIVGVVLNRVSTHENVYDYRYYSQDHQRHRKSGSRWLRLAQFFRKNTHPESRTDYGRKSA